VLAKLVGRAGFWPATLDAREASISGIAAQRTENKGFIAATENDLRARERNSGRRSIAPATPFTLVFRIEMGAF
jgi:hypothetical protein